MCVPCLGGGMTIPFHFAVVRLYFSSIDQLCLTLCDPMDCSIPGIPVHHQLLQSPQLMSTESVMPSNHLILCFPLLLLPSIFPSTRVFSNESVLRIRWPKYWSFGFSISPSNVYSGLISFRMDWLDLLCCPRDSQENTVIGFEHHTVRGKRTEVCRKFINWDAEVTGQPRNN